MIGAIVVDTVIDRRGRIVSVDADRLDVAVEWRAGQVTTLRPADIRAGRYQLVTPTPTTPQQTGE